MCGIAGIFGTEGLGDPSALVKAMTDREAHRGPDAEGIWADEHVALGHRRLSILDLSHAADQPFHSADGRYVIVYNGEIYNFKELRTQLPEQTYRTQGDTEVLLAAYAKWGSDCLARLNGMFAFAIWDREKKELFLARDRMGIKPLYLFRNDRQVVFASEIRAVLATGLVPREMDPDALVDHLRYQTVHAPRTIIKDVHMMLPGTWVRISDNEVHEEQWWRAIDHVDPGTEHQKLAVVHRSIREKLTRGVERRLVADVPFGAFLSGGIDSSAVVGLMAEVQEGPVHTFSVGFDEREFSEEHYAALVADRFRTEHTPIRLRPADMLRLLPDALAAMDHPSGDGPNTFVVSKVTREAGITMALSGLGGDELFAGYAVFQRSIALWNKRYITQFPMGIRKLAGSALRVMRPSASSTKAAELLRLPSFSIDDTYPVARLAFTDKEIMELIDRRTLPANRVRGIMHELVREQGAHRLPLLGQVGLGELNTYLQNVLLRDTDQMSMAHALEVRVPFLDHELVEYALGIADAQKYPTTPKRLLVEALGDLLPKEIVDRPKMGFTLPWARWMKEDLSTFCVDRLKTLGERPPFRPEGIASLWERFLADDPRVNWSRVWGLVVLEDWLLRNGVE